MKIILKTKIKKLGNIGDIVVVKDGYAKNLLIPSGFALFYTEKNYESFKLKKEELEKENAEKRSQAESLQRAIANRDIILIENAGDDGKLYGSISGAKIAKYINSQIKVNSLKKSNIILKENIKEVGKYQIVIELHSEVVFDKDVIIAKSKEEALKIKRGEKVVVKKEEQQQNYQQKVEQVTQTNDTQGVAQNDTQNEIKI
jgi:large subunit ribosomal protein L9